MKIQLTVNKTEHEVDIQAGENLVSVLRRLGYTEVRSGCDTGSCGLCTIWVDLKPVLSCSTLAARAQGSEITTIKGVSEEAKKLAAHLVREGADQCGYCSPGFIMTVLAMKQEYKNRLKDITENDIKHYLAGNLCRCTGYAGQTRAILNWLKEDSHVSYR